MSQNYGCLRFTSQKRQELCTKPLILYSFSLKVRPAKIILQFFSVLTIARLEQAGICHLFPAYIASHRKSASDSNCDSLSSPVREDMEPKTATEEPKLLKSSQVLYSNLVHLEQLHWIINAIVHICWPSLILQPLRSKAFTALG